MDGEPLIGRTKGRLNLPRVTVNNIDRIEILKGSSSSLYGSEAMGGVINIMTKNPQRSLGKIFQQDTADLNAEIDYANEKISVSGFINRLSSDEYDLNEDVLRQTVSLTAHSIQAKFKYKFNKNIDLLISGRFYNEPQKDWTIIFQGEFEIL